MSLEPENPAYLLQCMMDNMSDMIYFKDRDSKFIMLNKAAAEWQSGCTPDELVGTSDFDSYSKEDAQRMREDELRIMETGKPLFGLEEGETWKSGKHAWVSTTKMPLHDKNGNVIGIFGISRDITEHKEAELRAEKLAEQNRRFREEMEDDLRMASQLQKTFFPRSYPKFRSGSEEGNGVVEFYHLHQAGGLVGGDLCSIRKLSETQAGIFLCDVMGHGVRAAMGTSIVRAMVADISRQERDPGLVLQRLNQVLIPFFRQDDTFMFATTCYMVLDVTTGNLRMANAGHPMPVHLRPSLGSVEPFEVEPGGIGPGLAIDESAAYPTMSHKILPGDTVFMYTDGISEVANPEGQEFGQGRLINTAAQNRSLPLSELFQSIYDAACEFGESGTIEDDVCLVGFRLL
jgi:sigma-B regulation protein RsbU (phosphoserine phosphatase)